MILLDSNVWIALLNRSDHQHTKAKKLFFSLSCPLLITEYLVLEVTSVLSLRVDHRVAQEFLRLVRHNHDVLLLPSSVEFFTEVQQTFLASSFPRLSFVDHSILLLAQKYPVFTFDKALSEVIQNPSSPS